MGNTIHFVLQKKGGAGKSLIASTLFQFLAVKGYGVAGIDTDPSNKTFAKYLDLQVTKLELLGHDKKVDSRLFDTMLEIIYELPEGTHVVIDSGASCFHELISYLDESKALAMIQESGHQVYFQIPIVGGPGTVFSIDCLGELAEIFEDIPIIIWKNYFFGEISARNKTLEEFEIFLKYSDRIEGIIEIPQKNLGTYGKDIQIMQAQGMTYDQATTAATMPLMTRQRIKTFWAETCAAIDKAVVF